MYKSTGTESVKWYLKSTNVCNLLTLRRPG